MGAWGGKCPQNWLIRFADACKKCFTFFSVFQDPTLWSCNSHMDPKLRCTLRIKFVVLIEVNYLGAALSFESDIHLSILCAQICDWPACLRQGTISFPVTVIDANSATLRENKVKGVFGYADYACEVKLVSNAAFV